MKTKCYLLLTCFVLNCGLGFGQNYYEQACKEYWNEKGNLMLAVNLFTKAIQHKQELAQSYMYRGSARGLMEQYSIALKDLDSARYLDPDNYKVYAYYGKLYRGEGDFQTSLQYYEQAITKNPKDPLLYDDRAIVKGSLNRYKDAIADEDTAIALDPKGDNYYLNRAFARMQLHEDAAALADYNQSMALKPTYKCYADRGALYYQMKQYQKALDDFTKELEEVPQDYEVRYKRGEAYHALGQTEKACQDFKMSQQLGYAPAAEALEKNKCH